MRGVMGGGSTSGRAGRLATLGVAVCTFALLAFGVPAGDAATYYVSANGSDSNDGTLPTRAWRNVAKVNRAVLAPGDTVLFQGGATFSDATLMPDESGAAARPIVFASYGAGRATLTGGVWFDGTHYATFRSLAIRAAPRQGINATGHGISVIDCDIGGGSIGLNVKGSSWVIEGNRVADTGDSGLIVQGTGHVVRANHIEDTGRDATIAYGKHGIYLKSSDTEVVGNRISGFAANGVSARMRDSVIEGNVIEDGPIAIAWFQNDPVAGSSSWRWNTISGTTSAGIYVSPDDAAGPTTERFTIEGNTISRRSGVFMNLRNPAENNTTRANVFVGGTFEEMSAGLGDPLPDPPPPPPDVLDGFGNRGPTAAFDYAPTQPQIGQPVTFTSRSEDDDGQIVAEAWDLDDDGAFDDATGGQAQRAFANAGTYRVHLRVTDDDGATATVHDDVVVTSTSSGGGGGETGSGGETGGGETGGGETGGSTGGGETEGQAGNGKGGGGGGRSAEAPGHQSGSGASQKAGKRSALAAARFSVVSVRALPGGRFAVLLSLRETGRIVASLGLRGREVARGRATARRPGRLRVILLPRAAARRALRGRDAVRLVARIAFLQGGRVVARRSLPVAIRGTRGMEWT